MGLSVSATFEGKTFTHYRVGTLNATTLKPHFLCLFWRTQLRRQLQNHRMIHESKEIAKTKMIVYQDIREINIFERERS